MKKALVIVDMLNDFVTGKLASGREKSIIPNIQKLAKRFREQSLPVIYANDCHIPGDAEFKIWGEHALVGTEGASVIPELAPQKQDYVIPKRRYSAFTGTDLSFFLREREVQSLVLCGLHTHICVRHSSYDAFVEGFKIEIPKDCVQAFQEEAHLNGLEYLRDIYAAKILSSDEIILTTRETSGSTQIVRETVLG